ncbi:hypothetical protein FRB93_011049 [Tulasnella sp. JGI-2019a]|nr:hypothetical protein FRB93_011049 [Tulasnella sp. JGI-2019a]
MFSNYCRDATKRTRPLITIRAPVPRPIFENGPSLVRASSSYITRTPSPVSRSSSPDSNSSRKSRFGCSFRYKCGICGHGCHEHNSYAAHVKEHASSPEYDPKVTHRSRFL